MNKQELLQELAHKTFVKLQASPISGIGVFAIALIKKGERKIFSDDKSNWIPLSRTEVKTLPLHSQELVGNFCLYDEDNYFVPEYGFKMVDLVIYLNHSADPNIVSINDGAEFEALRDIQPGEELLIDYGVIVDH